MSVEVPPYASSVYYACDPCDILIEGYAVDPQEAPELFCPECGSAFDSTI